MKKIYIAIVMALAAASISVRSKAQAFYKEQPPVYSGYYPAEVINLYPNPARNAATVVLNYAPQDRVAIDLVDFSGNLRRTFTFNAGGRAFRFDVGFLERGYYLIRVREENRLIDILRLQKS